MKEISVKLKDREYKVYITSSMDRFSQALIENKIKDKDSMFIITDDKVHSIYKDSIEKLKEQYNVKEYCFKEGEENKNINTVQGIYSFLMENNANRNSLLIALGGGVVGDIVGFVASTYMRGIRYINIPTTLLSQVDSSVGGKVGYNYNGVKNIIGNFHHPEFVYISTNFLKTLEQKEFQGALGEVVKYALIRDSSFLNFLNENYKGILEKETDKMIHIIKNSLKIKSEIIKDDLNDRGIRNVLNFGHTVGHAIEINSGGKLTHGEAVALGMLTSIKLSENICKLRRELYGNIVNLYEKLRLPTKYKVDNYTLFMYAINRDKKNDDKIKFVLLEDLNEPKVKVEVNKKDIINALKNSIS
ncbi:3-dehydroquinate synthase [Clostridium sp. BSD9I1]|uniref:3-dehydroquinate synthase n=1 Tax=Clostridium sp. BSD9I1 TaxID=2003589 RepID=UPI001645B313|nr:3-dehydroquinate synthase [Clostridium sp. BSD9I1]